MAQDEHEQENECYGAELAGEAITPGEVSLEAEDGGEAEEAGLESNDVDASAFHVGGVEAQECEREEQVQQRVVCREWRQEDRTARQGQYLVEHG